MISLFLCAGDLSYGLCCDQEQWWLENKAKGSLRLGALGLECLISQEAGQSVSICDYGLR